MDEKFHEAKKLALQLEEMRCYLVTASSSMNCELSQLGELLSDLEAKAKACDQSLYDEQQAHQSTKLTLEEMMKRYYLFSMELEGHIENVLGTSEANVALQATLAGLPRLSQSESDQNYLRSQLKFLHGLLKAERD